MLIKILAGCVIALFVMFLLTCLHYDKRIKTLEEAQDVMLTTLVNLIDHQSKQDHDISELQRRKGQ